MPACDWKKSHVSIRLRLGTMLQDANNKNTLGAHEARAHLSNLLEKVIAGEEITITKHGSPIAKLVPLKRNTTFHQRAAAIQRIRSLSENLRLRGLKTEDLIAEGRKRAKLSLLICRRGDRASNF
jgi:prevent-host-death family protein